MAKVTLEMKYDMRGLRAVGWTYKEIGKLLGVSYLTVFFHTNPEAYEKHTRAVKEYQKAHPERIAETRKRSRKTHPEQTAEAMARYYSSPKGMACRAKVHAKRRDRSTDPELYAARVKQLHIEKENCSKCGAEYSITHEIDHVVALCLGGTDTWNNYRPLCVKCHRKKNGQDIQALRKVCFYQWGARPEEREGSGIHGS